MHRRKRNIVKSLALGLAVAALAAPAALGEPRGPGNTDPLIADAIPAAGPDDRSLSRGTSARLAPGNVAPDDRSLYRGASAQVEPRIVSPDDRSLSRGGEISNVPVNITVSSPSEGFQWSDAGLGAASTLLFVLLLGAATFLIRQQRQRVAY